MGKIKQLMIKDWGENMRTLDRVPLVWSPDYMTIKIDYVHTHEDHELTLEVEGLIDPPEKGDLESQDFMARAWLIETRLDGKKWKGELTNEETCNMEAALLEAWEATI